MIIKITTENKQVIKSPTPPRKIQYQKQSHHYVIHNIRRVRYKRNTSKRRNKRKRKRRGKKGKLKVLPKVWDSEYKWLPLLDQNYSNFLQIVAGNTPII